MTPHPPVPGMHRIGTRSTTLPSSSLFHAWVLRSRLHPPNIMDFAPYQDTAPEQERALSPPPRRSSSRSPAPKSPPPPRSSTDPFAASALPPPSHFGSDARGFGSGTAVEGGRPSVNLFDTSLPMRLDYEAMLAYLLLPPVGGVFLLVMEHKSDYVRCVIPSS